MDASIKELSAGDRQKSLAEIHEVLQEVLTSHSVPEDVQVAIGRSPCKDLQVFIEFFNAKDDVRMDAPRLFKYAGLDKQEVKTVSSQLVNVWVDAKKAAFAAKKAAAAAKKNATKKSPATPSRVAAAPVRPPAASAPTSVSPSPDGPAAGEGAASAEGSTVGAEPSPTAEDNAGGAATAPAAANCLPRAPCQAATLRRSLPGQKRGPLRLERGAVVRVRNYCPKPGINGLEGICLGQAADMWTVHVTGGAEAELVQLPRDNLEVLAKSNCCLCGPSMKRMKAVQKENGELKKRARTGEPGRDDVIRGVARLECLPLLQCAPDLRKEWKRKLMLKWHPDKAPSAEHALLATEVVQEMRTLEAWDKE